LQEFYAAIASALQAREPLAVATLVQSSGSTPREPGAQMLVWADGRTRGTVGGGAVEAAVIQDALAALRSGHSALHDYSLQAGEAGALGVCGGSASVFVHVLQPAGRVVICGAGHVAQPLARLALDAGYQVLVVDDRPEYLAPDRFPHAATQLVSFAGLLECIAPDERTAIVVVTRSHEHDETVLRQVLAAPASYLGVIGSRTKVARMFQGLRAAGYDNAQLARVHAPIGLDIGAQTPAEIAVAILAEIIQARLGGSGRPLSELHREPGDGR
jgi:xanthine dehydrogenase accessory factor